MQFGRRSENSRLAILLTLLAACFLMGGASRSDVLSLILLQPLAAVCTAAILVIPGPIEWRSIRAPLLLLATLAAVIAAQLVPLPPAVWANLPGHGPFAESARVAGLDQPWRPISLTPDLTLASLVGLIVPLGMLIGIASVSMQHRRTLLTALVAGAATSAFFGLAQVSAGEQSPFYLYSVTNFGTAVGLFSNRNHQAVLLAMSWPLLAVWATLPHPDPQLRAARRWVAVGIALFALPLLLVTGSRAGLFLAVIGLGSAGWLWHARSSARDLPASGLGRLAPLAVGLGGILLLVATILLSRAQAIRRLLDLSGAEDTRIEAVPVLLDMSKDFFPVGSGFGSFDPVFRYYEPLRLLGPQYLNHAHNDVLEMLITGGLPGMAVALAFVVWLAVRGWNVWRSKNPSLETALARVGSVMILLALLSSVVDYPLRTPLMMAIIAIACAWLAGSGGRGRPAGASPTHPK